MDSEEGTGRARCSVGKEHGGVELRAERRITTTRGDGGFIQEGEGLLNSFVRHVEFFLARKELLGGS